MKSDKVREPVWVVAYEYGTKDSGGGAGFDWFPHLDDAVKDWEQETSITEWPVTAYFVEWWPEATGHGSITEEIEVWLWDYLPDDRPDE